MYYVSMKLKLTILFFTAYIAHSHTISIDVGKTETNFNRFSVPNESQNKLSLNSDDSLTSFRLTGLYNLGSGNQLYFIIAPLTTTTNFVPLKNFEFDGENYLLGEDTNVSYKFNSYRFGYLWRWNLDSADLWGGVV